MKFLKKLAVLTAAVVLAANSAAFAAFTDMPDGEIGNALNNAVENGLITGYEDNTIRPDDLITRAQMAAIITRAFGAVEKSETSFPDVADNAWYIDSVKKAVAMNIFKGDENGNFNPENNITFQETYTVLARAFYLEPKVRTTNTLQPVSDDALDAFSDKDKVADWAQIYVKSVVDNGGFNGINGMLKPLDYITRGEFALVMDELVTTYIDDPGTYEGLPDGLTMIRTGGVTISGLESSRNVIVSYGVDKTGCAITDCKVQGAIIILGAANPTEFTDEETGEKYLHASDEATVTLTGDYVDVRVMSPYVSLSANSNNPNVIPAYYGVKYSKISANVVQ